MAIVHPGSVINPTKAEMLAAWLPTQDWWPSGADVGDIVANFRFDDPAGEVGIETLVVQAGDQLVQAPVTYRDAPFEDGALVCEMDHSALGKRWVYDGLTDPVYRAAATAAIREEQTEVDMFNPAGDPVPPRATAANVRGSGGDGQTLEVPRHVPVDNPPDSAVLTATWQGQDSPVVLAWLA